MWQYCLRVKCVPLLHRCKRFFRFFEKKQSLTVKCTLYSTYNISSIVTVPQHRLQKVILHTWYSTSFFVHTRRGHWGLYFKSYVLNRILWPQPHDWKFFHARIVYMLPSSTQAPINFRCFCPWWKWQVFPVAPWHWQKASLGVLRQYKNTSR